MGQAQFDTVFFDFDGTLMDTNELIFKSWRHTIKTYDNRYMSTEEIMDTFGEPMDVTMRSRYPHLPIEEAIDTYREFQNTMYEELIEMFPGMYELIHTLKDRGYKIAMVTNRLRNTTLIGLDKFSVTGLFDVIVTADDVPRAKPDPMLLLLAMERIGSKPESTIMIGDTLHDIHAAKAAGVSTVLVDWSIAIPPAKRQNLTAKEKPDVVVYDAMDILRYIEKR
ncbi:MAG: HAD-IA family hydrolase [Clostridiales Family XIII bacterium]|jgi:pyrophosphatase PpaX|nr:HAD-IA family hydrolase [Clostridiales Family XIII bacterium]